MAPGAPGQPEAVDSLVGPLPSSVFLVTRRPLPPPAGLALYCRHGQQRPGGAGARPGGYPVHLPPRGCTPTPTGPSPKVRSSEQRSAPWGGAPTGGLAGGNELPAPLPQGPKSQPSSVRMVKSQTSPKPLSLLSLLHLHGARSSPSSCLASVTEAAEQLGRQATLATSAVLLTCRDEPRARGASTAKVTS